MVECYRLQLLLVLGTLALDATMGDNDVKNGISDICVDCLRKVLPSPDVVCLPPSNPGESQRCGDFKMKEPFYQDCLVYMKSEMKNVTEDWNTWKKCYEDYECGKSCVRAYHNHYTSACATGKSNGKQPLTCADYGQIHNMGSNSCGRSDSVATGFIKNMTLLCGCLTVHGNRSKCLLESQCDGVSTSTFAATAVGIVCGAVLVIIGLIIALCSSHRRNRGLVARTDGDGVHDNSQTEGFLAKSSQAPLYCSKSPSIEDHQKIKLDEPRRYSARPPSIGELNKSSSCANTHGLTMNDEAIHTAPPPTAERIPDIVESDYVNAQGLSAERDSSPTDCSSSSQARAPIPAPRD